MFTVYDRFTRATIIVARTEGAAVAYAARLNRTVEAGRYAVRTQR
jgi:hypothetical protein